ncbi:MULTISPECIES: hypothetical protein [Acetobacter]|jgi:hypothetical protein|uniref:hypothetical protein n=1 Tax=Acetobacter TaxID=434 RepID=UPI00376FAF92
MTRVPFVRGLFALAGIGLSVMATSSSVHAERVLSDLEASKLTFASLTAPPPVVHVRHIVHHTATASHAPHKVVLASAQHGKMVHLVSYHPSAHTAIHGSKPHRRT